MGVVDIDCSVVTEIYEDSLTIFMIIILERENLIALQHIVILHKSFFLESAIAFINPESSETA